MEELSVKFTSNKEVTYEDLREMAEEIFAEKRKNLEELKNTPWYKKFIKSVVFQRGDTKLVAKNEISLATLQSIFLKLYIQELKDQNTAINSIIEDVIKTQVAVKTIYDRCVLGSVELGNIASLKKDNNASEYLVWVLTRFHKDLDLDEDGKKNLQSYNMAIREYLGVAVTKKFNDIKKIEHIAFHDVFYRCLLEQCIITDRYDKENEDFDFPESVLETIEYLNVSDNKKQELMDSVKSELESFGKDSFIKKYSITKEWIDENELELEDELENHDTQKNQEQNNFSVNDSFDKLKEIVTAVTTLESEPLGKILDKEDRKQWLLTRLAFLTPKTVITITKGDNFYLLFTTHAFYLYESGGLLSGENIWSIPYENISSTNIATELNKEADKFIFEDNGKRIAFSDKKINVQKLEQLLLDVKGVNNFAKTDKKLNFAKLSLDAKVGYYHIISAILQENKQPLFELFRVVSDNGLANNWEKIIKAENNIESFILNWHNKIPYPYEEAIALKLIGDICTVLQFTKQSEALTANDKKYFSLILRAVKESEREDVIKNQIIWSQVEKKFIEGKQIESELEKLMGYVQNNKYGILSVTSSSVVSIGLMVLGPLGWISRIVSFMGLSIFDYISKRKVREANKAELREKLYKETYLSYKRALKTSEKMDNIDLGLRQKLREGMSVLQNNSGFTEQVLLSTHNDEIEETIKSFLNNPKIKFGEVVIANKLNYFSLQKLIAQMSFSLGSEDSDSVIGLYTGTVLGNLTGNYSGILFVKEGCYIKSDNNSPIKFIFYSEIRNVSVKGTILQEVILSLSDGTSVKLDGLYYKDVGTDELFNKIAAYNRSEI